MRSRAIRPTQRNDNVTSALLLPRPTYSKSSQLVQVNEPAISILAYLADGRIKQTCSTSHSRMVSPFVSGFAVKANERSRDYAAKMRIFQMRLDFRKVVRSSTGRSHFGG